MTTGTREAAWTGWGGITRCSRWEPPTVPRGTARAVVIAPHPDDETLAVGGTMQRLTTAGWDIDLVVVTDGDASHDDWPGGPSALAATRREELAGALRVLAVGSRCTVVRLGFPDGGVTRAEGRLAEAFGPFVRDAALVLAPHPDDGHPDHDAVGRVAFDLARAHDLPAAAYGVWLWEWSEPGDARYSWVDAVGVALDDEQRARKQDAVAGYRSQITAGPSGEPILPAEVLEHHARDVEVLFVMNGTLP
jgi:LmbE family N-acetylglucosaminyl deacetylase